ncbi:fibronectin type III domain-containing protein [Brevibacillus migulae]|uniref:hypothetical protein n=1 Tax=Brevibacillus migulae TaxID=1644114 RepID=UPI00106EF9A3|nr:hypothetical protein [Brevibacillus migulae]
MMFVDENGFEDQVYTVKDAVMEYKGNKLKINRPMPDIDDSFIVEDDHLKHAILIQSWQRDPVPFLSGRIDFVISGELRIDPDLQVHADGMNIVGPFETDGDIKIYDGDRLVFTLPKIVAYDSNMPDRSEMHGRYRVKSNEDGLLAFDIVMDNAWVGSDERVYPILIDPTVVTNGISATIQANGGRKLIRMSNGWLIASNAYSNSTQFRLFVSKDGGVNWSQLCYYTVSGGYTLSDHAIASVGNKIHWIVSYSNGSIEAWEIDATTQTNTNISGDFATKRKYYYQEYSYPPSGVSITYDGINALHVAFCKNIGTYSNSANVFYLKATVDANGSATYGQQVQVTNNNNNMQQNTNPTIVFANGEPVIIAEYYYGSSVHNINVFKQSGLPNQTVNGWFTKVVYAGGNYAQSFPCAVLDSAGTIHLVWHSLEGNDQGGNVRYSKSTDYGVNWSTSEKLTSGVGTTGSYPSIGLTSDNKPVVLFFTTFNEQYEQIYRLMFNGTSWSAATRLTNEQASQRSPSLMEKDSGGVFGYVWMDFGSSALKYETVFDNPTTPVVTAPNGGETIDAQYTVAWTASGLPSSPVMGITTGMTNQDTVATPTVNSKVGQTITVDQDGYITRVEMYGRCAAASVTMTIEGVDANGYPDGVVKASATVETDSSNAYRGFLLSTPLAVTAGQKLAICMQSPTHTIVLVGSNVDWYLGGKAFNVNVGFMTGDVCTRIYYDQANLSYLRTLPTIPNSGVLSSGSRLGQTFTVTKNRPIKKIRLKFDAKGLARTVRLCNVTNGYGGNTIYASQDVRIDAEGYVTLDLSNNPLTFPVGTVLAAEVTSSGDANIIGSSGNLYSGGNLYYGTNIDANVDAWLEVGYDEGSNAKYQVQLSTNGKGSWKDLIALTAAGVTSYLYDFSAEPETNQAFVRVRGYDGQAYSPWDESNAAFAIQHRKGYQMML